MGRSERNSSFSMDSTNPPTNQALSNFAGMAHSLMMWENPTYNGVTIFTINLVFYLFTFGGFSFPQLVILTFWITLVSRLAFVIGVHTFAIFRPEYKDVPQSLGAHGSTISEADFKPVSDTILGGLNWINSFCGRVCSCQDMYLVLQVLVVLHVSSYLASFFSLASLSYIALMGMFIIPRLFSEHKEKIMAQMAELQKMANGHLGKLIDAIPKASQLKQKTE